jgi:hypothetical protein
MLYREIIAVCSEIHTKHINTLCGQTVEFSCTLNRAVHKVFGLATTPTELPQLWTHRIRQGYYYFRRICYYSLRKKHPLKKWIAKQR